MSTSLLYHGPGICGYRYIKTLYEQGSIVLVIEQPRDKYRCSHCGSANVVSRGRTPRRFRTLPLGRKPVLIEYEVHRLHCWSCHHTRQPNILFAETKKHYTKSLARYVLKLSRLMAIKDVASHLGLSWDRVKGLQKKSLTKHYAKPKLKRVNRIAIDEISPGEGASLFDASARPGQWCGDLCGTRKIGSRSRSVLDSPAGERKSPGILNWDSALGGRSDSRRKPTSTAVNVGMISETLYRSRFRVPATAVTAIPR